VRGRRVLGLALAVAIAAAPSRTRAGPWTPDPGTGYVKLWVKYLEAYPFDYWPGNGSPRGYGFYNELFWNAYGEIGIVDGLAAWLHWPFLETFLLEDPRTGRVSDHTVSGDPTLGLRWRFLQAERFVMAIDAGVRFPFAPAGEVQTVYAREPGNPAIGALRVGTGVFDFPVALSLGYGWDSFYLAGSGGWVARTGAFDHVLTWTAEGGGTFRGGLSLRVRVVGWHAVGNGDPVHYHESPSGIGSGTSYVGIAVEMDYPIAPSWWLGGTVEGGLGALSRQTGGPVVTLYVATRFSLLDRR
jgi:hypothetical protein